MKEQVYSYCVPWVVKLSWDELWGVSFHGKLDFPMHDGQHNIKCEMFYLQLLYKEKNNEIKIKYKLVIDTASASMPIDEIQIVRLFI